MSNDNDSVLPLARLSQWLITPTLNVCIYSRVTLPNFGFKPFSFVFLFCQNKNHYRHPVQTKMSGGTRSSAFQKSTDMMLYLVSNRTSD